MRISFQRLRDMVGWLIKGCTILPLRKSAIHFEDFCVFCIGKLGGLPGSSAALLVTNCCHAVLKLPAVVSDQLFCHQSRQMLPSHKRCNSGNSSSGWLEMQLGFQQFKGLISSLITSRTLWTGGRHVELLKGAPSAYNARLLPTGSRW